MTNCCNDYGTCRQSDDCPVRTSKVLSHQAAHARRVACGQQVARIGASRPKWLDGKGAAVPPEAGNFKILDLGPDDYDYSSCQPLTYAENMALVRALLSWLLAVVVVVGALALAVSYTTEAHADVLWAFLAGLS